MPITIKIEGLDDLRRLLRGDELYVKPWREGMQKIGELAQRLAQDGAPVKTGALRKSIRARVAKKGFPKSIRVIVYKRGPAKYGRYPYPKVLEYGRKWGHYYWLHDILRPLGNAVGPVLDRIGAEIARKWAGR